MRTVEENKVEVLKVLNIIDYFKKVRGLSVNEVSRILNLNRRIINYWENGDYKRGIKNETLYIDVIKNVLDYYEGKTVTLEKEKHFLETLKNRYNKLN